MATQGSLTLDAALEVLSDLQGALYAAPLTADCEVDPPVSGVVARSTFSSEVLVNIGITALIEELEAP